MSKPHVLGSPPDSLGGGTAAGKVKVLEKHSLGVMAFKTRTTLFTVLVLLTSACSTRRGLNSAPTEASTTQVPATTNGSVAEWKEILPGRPAVCSDGSDYKFLTRAGNAKTVGVHARWRRMLVSQKLRCTAATHLHHQCRSVKRLSDRHL